MFSLRCFQWCKKSAKGFTLIELMLVVAIVGLLAAIAIPKFGNMVDKAREAAVKANIGNLRSALAIYYADNEGIYPMYGIPFNMGSGLLELDGKYVDLGNVIFRVPRYLASQHGSGAASARTLYAIGSLLNNNDFGPPPNLNFIFDSWPAAYSCWSAAPWIACSYAQFRPTCVHQDLSGKVWSLF